MILRHPARNRLPRDHIGAGIRQTCLRLCKQNIRKDRP